MAIGSVVRPGPTRNKLISRLPKEETNPNSAAATTPGRIAGSVTRRRVTQGSAPRLCAASSSVRSNPANVAVTKRTEDRQPSLRGDLQLDVRDIKRRAKHDAGDHQRKQEQADQEFSAGESESPDAEGSGHSHGQSDRGRQDPQLQAQQESVYEARVADPSRIPAQGIPLRRVGGNLLPIERQPDHHQERREDVEE